MSSWLVSMIFETDAEDDPDIVAVHAVLRKHIESVQVLISEGECSRRVKGVHETRLRIDPGAGEPAEFVGKADTTIKTEGVAGVAIEILIDSEHKAIAKKVAFLTK